MKKQALPEKNPAEKVLEKLSGHFEIDRKLLISSIKDFRKRNVHTQYCQVLGVELYKLLLENGLNESDVINVDRLIDKIDGFLYNNQIETALDVLEVIDAVQPFQKIDPNGNKVYCFENQIEANIFEIDGIITKDISWIESARPNLLARKAKILLDNNKTFDALDVVADLLEINPVSFEGHILKAQCYREKNPKRFKEYLQMAYRYAYKPTHFVQMFVNFYNYYADKEDWVTAYAVLSAVKVYEVNDDLLGDLERLKEKMTRTVVTPFKVPTPEQIMVILEREKIEIHIKDQNYRILIDLYEQLFMSQDNKVFMKEIAEYIQGFAGQEDILKIIEKRLKSK